MSLAKLRLILFVPCVRADGSAFLELARSRCKTRGFGRFSRFDRKGCHMTGLPPRRLSPRLLLLLAFLLAPLSARAGDCAAALQAFEHMLQVSKFTAEGARRMFAAHDKALAFQKAGRDGACVRVLARATRGEP
jgi:hypothetical protein